MNQTTNLGEGSVGRLLLRLSMPAILAQLVNMLYNIVDRMYIGHIPEIGAAALTGVGVTFPILMLISAFAALVGMGGAPRAAIKMGEQDPGGAEQIMGNCASVLLVCSIVLTAFFLLFGKQLLLLFGASENTIGYALSYMNIYVCGTVFVQFALGLNAFITTQGFARTSMLTVVIGAAINIILDPIFIFGFNMGVSGAALATIISQAVSAIWVVRFLCSKKSTLRIHKKNLKVRMGIIGPVFALGISPFIMQSTESLLNVAFNSSLQRYGGDIAVGSMAILASLMQVLFLPLMGLTQGAQPIISYNFGAKKNDRVRRTFFLLLISAVTFSTVLWLAAMFLPHMFTAIFTQDAALTEFTIWAMRIYLAAVFILGAQTACQQTFIAVGKASSSLFLALLRKIILLIPLIYILPNFFENKVFGVFLAEPVADLIATAVTITLFAIQFKKILANNSLPE